MNDNTDFIEKVTDLFLQYGAKSITMDDVAKSFGMSKKTLYQKYRNKDALLEEVLKYKLQDLLEHNKCLDDAYDNALDRMMCKDGKFEEATSANKSLLLKQIIKYYPAIFKKHMENFANLFSDVLIANVKLGREQGYYRKDFNEEMYSKLFFQTVISYDSSPFMEDSPLEKHHYVTEAIDFYLNAITTEKGKEYLKKLKNKYEKTV